MEVLSVLMLVCYFHSYTPHRCCWLAMFLLLSTISGDRPLFPCGRCGLWFA